MTDDATLNDKTTIFRKPHSRDHPYAIVSKTVFEDPEISWKAKGIMGYLLSRPDDWQVWLSDLIKRSTDGRHAVRTAVLELEITGYMTRHQTRDTDGTFSGYEIHIHEHPVPVEHRTEPIRRPRRPKSGNRISEPESENPTSEKPTSENRTLTIIDLTNIEGTNRDPLSEVDDFADLFPGKPSEPVAPSAPGILSTEAARDPLSLSAECQKRQAASGLGSWTVPVEAGGSDPAGDQMLAAWCNTLSIDPQVMPDDMRNRYRARLAKLAKTLPSSTPEQAAHAVEIVLDPNNQEFSWYTYTDPSVAKFERDWTTVMFRILSGNEPDHSASGIDALDRMIERTPHGQ